MTPEENKKALAVDHCHASNKNRGLLCNNCNVSIGFLGENTKKAEMTIKYIEKWRD